MRQKNLDFLTEFSNEFKCILDSCCKGCAWLRYPMLIFDNVNSIFSEDFIKKVVQNLSFWTVVACKYRGSTLAKNSGILVMPDNPYNYSKDGLSDL